MEADRGAPVFAETGIDIAAQPDSVWNVLTDFERWPSWNPDVKSMSMSGYVAPGTAFKWKSGPATITSTIEHVERPRLIAWSGRTFGMTAKHVYRLDARDGVTHVRTEESFDGWLARLLRGQMRKTLQTALDNGLRHLKAEAERDAAR